MDLREGAVEFRHIRYFVTVAEYGHVTRAAQALHVAQPAVSQGLRQLERELGLTLFERSHRGMVLTDAGERLLPDARAALAHAQRVAELAREAVSGRLGVLNVGYVPFVTDRLITGAVQIMRERRPDVDVVLHEVAFLARLEALQDRRIDVVLATLPFDDPGFERGPVVHRGQRVLAVPTGHPLEQRAPLTAEDLAGQTIATTEMADPPPWAASWLPTSTPLGKPIKRGPVVSTVGEVLTAVAAGQVVQLMPSEIARVYRRDGMSFLEIDMEGYEIVPVWRPDGYTAMIATFVQALREAGDSG